MEAKEVIFRNTMRLKNIGKETITHVLFRGQKMTSIHDKYEIELFTHNGKFKFVVEVNDEENICLDIPRINDYIS